jgi:hypothetical protein
VQGLLTRAYYELAIGQDDRYAGFKLLAGKIYERYQVKTAKGANTRIALPPYDDLNARCSTGCSTRNKARLTPRAPCCAPSSDAGGNQCAARRRRFHQRVEIISRHFPATNAPASTAANNFRRRPPPFA